MTAGLNILLCTSCDRPLYFTTRKTNLIRCSCGGVMSRSAHGEIVAKPYRPITHHTGVINPGTKGIYAGKHFTVLGCVKTWASDEVLNYWTISFSDEEVAWLCEGYGLYAIYSDLHINPDVLQNTGRLTIGKDYSMNDERYVLTNKSEVYSWEMEGEVFFPLANPDFEAYFFSAASGSHLAAFQITAREIVLKSVTFVEFSDLQLTNITSHTSPKKFHCSGCNHEILVKTFPLAMSCTCLKCGRYYGYKNGKFTYLNKSSLIERNGWIEIGSKGVIEEHEYECLGFILKEEQNANGATWFEYTLYNPERGFAFLSEYNGHWIFLREKGDSPVLIRTSESSFNYNNEPYQLFNAYGFRILSAEGEFPYNAFIEEDVYCREFISPPEVWILETSDTAITWFKGVHIKGAELKNQFQFPNGLPPKSGVGAIEPKFFISPPKLAFVSLIAVIVIMLLHSLTIYKEEKIVFEDAPAFSSSDTVITVVREIEVTKWKTNITLDISAAVSNDWLQIEGALVNKNTGTEHTVEKAVEYYSGYEGGEHWTEGSREATIYFSSIPRGKYTLQIMAIRSPNTYIKLPFYHLRVFYDVPVHNNLFWSVGLILIWPVIQFLRTNTNEKERWRNSPYSNYTYED